MIGVAIAAFRQLKHWRMAVSITLSIVKSMKFLLGLTLAIGLTWMVYLALRAHRRRAYTTATIRKRGSSRHINL